MKSVAALVLLMVGTAAHAEPVVVGFVLDFDFDGDSEALLQCVVLESELVADAIEAHRGHPALVPELSPQPGAIAVPASAVEAQQAFGPACEPGHGGMQMTISGFDYPMHGFSRWDVLLGPAGFVVEVDGFDAGYLVALTGEDPGADIDALVPTPVEFWFVPAP
jgi:hypothetical protein